MSRCNEYKNNDDAYSYVRTFNSFFSALFEFTVDEYLSSTSQESSMVLWDRLCERLGLTKLAQPIESIYWDLSEHFQVRVALLLEECLHTFSEALTKIGGSTGQSRNQMLSLPELPIQRIVQYYENSLVTLQLSATPYNIDEVDTIRPGAVYLCAFGNEPPIMGVVRTGNRDYIESNRSFVMTFFSPKNDCIAAYGVVTLTYVTQFITQFRCYEALTSQYKVHFVSHLLGTAVNEYKSSTSANGDDDNDLLSRNLRNLQVSEAAAFTASENISDYFHAPRLNAAQDKAAQTFLSSESSTITIVQGPPGTGKTTLLVAILCRYCMESLSGSTHRRRILVSAPTNKAVSVLATRFIKALKEETNVSVILVGDADKLFSGDKNRTKRRSDGEPTNQDPLKSIFIYTWMRKIIEGLTRIRNYSSTAVYTGRDSIATLLPLARQLRQQLTRSLPHLSYHLTERMDQIVDELERQKSFLNRIASSTLEELVKSQIWELKSMKSEDVQDQLLESAHVIFCTLASAGGAALKKTSDIDDLIVDEAAAATEPELYIPFHLQPQRLLIVGDPLQLPATVMSPRATNLGLAKSLHERLMYDCKYDHIMLDVQYRMHPEISVFPSARFYDSKIGNGPNVSSPAYAKGAVLLNRQPYTFLQLEGQEEQMMGGSWQNRKEAEMIVELISKLKQLTVSTWKDEWCGTDRIRVITFYVAQVACIQRCLNERGLGNTVLVATVDSSQGCEADIVLISFVRSRPRTSINSRAPSAGFLEDDRRMNVAMTRAKYQLICVGNVGSFHQMANAPTLHLLAKDAEERGVICTPPPLRVPNNRSVGTARRQSETSRRKSRK